MLTLILSVSVVVADQTQLRSALRTAPDMATEVAKDFAQNVQIHDSFASEAAADVEVEKRIESNPELQALVQIHASQVRSTGRTAPDMAAEVAREGKDNIQIHDGFASMAASDVEAEKHVEANRNLQALLQVDRRQLQPAHVTKKEKDVPAKKEKNLRPVGEGAHQDAEAVKQRTTEKNMDCEDGNWNDCHGPGGDFTNSSHFPKPPKKSGAAFVTSSIGLTLAIIIATVQ